MIIDKDAPGVADLMRQHIRLSLTVAAIDALDEQLGNVAKAKPQRNPAAPGRDGHR